MARSLEEIQDELLDRVHAGEAIDRAALLAAFPEHAQDLEAFLDLLDVVEGTNGEDSLPPSSLGEYRIIREIGRGGMGVVYEAEQASLKRRVALKVLPPALRMDTRLVKRFRREAEAAGRLSHPGIVPVFGVGQAGDTPFFAMEFVPGSTLRTILQQRKAGENAGLPTEPSAWRRWAVETCAAVADALAYAHGEGILHRDVKPGNILINEEGTPRLTDFGLARDLRSPGLSLTGEVLGSPQYMSPEQAIRHDKPVDEHTDIYSLAVTLYQLLTLKLPYPAETQAELLTALAAGRVIPPRQVDPGLSRPLEQVLLRALRREPQDRYATAAAFAADLRAAIEGRKPAYREPLLVRMRVPALIALAAAGVLAVVLVTRPETPTEPPPPLLTSDAAESQDKTKSPQPGTLTAPTPPPQPSVAEQVTEILRAYSLRPPTTRAGFRGTLAPLLAQADSTATSKAERGLVSEALRTVYTDYVAGPGSEDVTARAFLGHRKFDHEVPEAISNRNHPFLRAVEWATAKGWFKSDEAAEYALAKRAWDRTELHLERLIHDTAFNRGDRAAAMLGRDKRLAPFHLTPLWSSPYLICYVAPEATSPFDTLMIEDPVERRTRMRQLEARAGEVEAVLDEDANVFGQLYQEYLRRFEKPLHLKPLMSPWGGRPDYPAAVRSFREGVPLIVLVFADHQTFLKHENPPSRAWGSSLVTPYFSPASTRIYLYDEGSIEDDPEAAQPGSKARRRALLGTYQLEFWFGRQRRHWRKPHPRQDFFQSGMAAFLGAVAWRRDGSLDFHGLSPWHLGRMQAWAPDLVGRGKPYPFFPLKELLAFDSLNAAKLRGTELFGIEPSMALDLFNQQSWAFLYFLNTAEQGAYRERFEKYHNLSMQGERGLAAAREAFRLRDEGDWSALERSFQTYVKEHLLKLALPVDEAAEDTSSGK